MPFKQIAAQVGIAVGTAYDWTRDIEITPEQARRNRYGPGGAQHPETQARRQAAWSERNRERRRRYQEAGRKRARERDPLHMAGCMLYWAEGAKSRNSVILANSDANMMRMFARFLGESMGVAPGDFRIRLNVYLNNGLVPEEIEQYWLEALGAPSSSLRGHTLNHFPTSSSGKKRSLPYGVCTLRVARSTWLIQHIFGAIQEYGGFEEPRWLDGPTQTGRKKPKDPPG